MFYQEIPAHEVEPDSVLGIGKNVVVVDTVVKRDADRLVLMGHTMFDPAILWVLEIGMFQLVTKAYGGSATETETIQ